MAMRNNARDALGAPGDRDGDHDERDLWRSVGGWSGAEFAGAVPTGQAAAETHAPESPASLLLPVTVVIPAHNEARYLAAALQSVVEQDYPLHCLECVVVDNASTDGTAQIAAAFATQHRELHVVIVAEPVLGVSRAKNRGSQQATGALLLFLDADSRCTPHLVRDVVTHYHAGSPAGSIRIVADSDSFLERGFFALMELGPVLFGIRSQMFYCGRTLFRALGGFDEALRLAEDLEFLQRAKKVLGHQRTGSAVCHVCHIRSSAIATSPRRLRTLPCHLSIVTLFVRWALAFAGIGRKQRYSA